MKIVKNIIIVGIIFLVIVVTPIKNYAAGSILDNLNDLDKYGQLQGPDTHDEFDKRANQYIYIIQVVASFVSVICMIVLGIKYLTASIEQKAQYKKTLLPYIIGAAIVFASTNILAIIYDTVIKNL